MQHRSLLRTRWHTFTVLARPQMGWSQSGAFHYETDEAETIRLEYNGARQDISTTGEASTEETAGPSSSAEEGAGPSSGAAAVTPSRKSKLDQMLDPEDDERFLRFELPTPAGVAEIRYYLWKHEHASLDQETIVQQAAATGQTFSTVRAQGRWQTVRSAIVRAEVESRSAPDNKKARFERMARNLRPSVIESTSPTGLSGLAKRLRSSRVSMASQQPPPSLPESSEVPVKKADILVRFRLASDVTSTSDVSEPSQAPAPEAEQSRVGAAPATPVATGIHEGEQKQEVPSIKPSKATQPDPPVSVLVGSAEAAKASATLSAIAALMRLEKGLGFSTATTDHNSPTSNGESNIAASQSASESGHTSGNANSDTSELPQEEGGQLQDGGQYTCELEA